jgi:hypothetical protein
MVAASRLTMADLSRQKRLTTDLAGRDLSPAHNVGQAVDLFVERMGIPHRDLRWTAFSRGVKLDAKKPLEEVPDEDAEWTVMPEVSAG